MSPTGDYHWTIASILLPLLMHPAGPHVPLQPPPTSAQVQAWVTELSSDEFRRREAATILLSRSGAAAVPALVSLAGSEDLEAASRGMLALGSMLQLPDDDASFAAEEALYKLKVSPDPRVNTRATDLLALSSTLIERRALLRLERYGAFLSLENIRDRAPALASRRIIFTDEWKGGDEEFVRLARAGDLQAQIYLIDGCNISDDAVKRLTEQFSNAFGGAPLAISRRGRCLLGITNNSPAVGEGCVINSVSAGSTADVAGLMPGDVIVEFDGKPVKSFDDVTSRVRKHREGDVVPVIAVRSLSGEAAEFKLTLQGWVNAEMRKQRERRLADADAARQKTPPKASPR